MYVKMKALPRPEICDIFRIQKFEPGEERENTDDRQLHREQYFRINFSSSKVSQNVTLFAA